MIKKNFLTTSITPKLTLITLALMSINTAYSTAYNTRATGQFLAGDHQQLGGFADVMLPFMQTQNRIFFADGAVLAGQNNRATYSGGLGYRAIKETDFGRGIVGAYAFTDYYKTDLKNSLWQLNPGLEWLTERYETRLQGYIPLNSRTQAYSNTLASNIPQHVLFDSGRPNTLFGATGHSLINTPVQLVEEFGPGIELEAGKFFDYGKGLWARVGGYYFSYHNASNIGGVQANIEMAVNDYAAVILQDNYDGQNKNRFSIGLRVNFGGSDAPKHTLESRMTSPIIRHAARQSYGEAQPSRQNFRASGATFSLGDNIWFFSPRGTFPPGAATTLANCTAESPCLTIDSTTAAQIALISPNASFYFETGTYLIPEGSPRIAYLENGQSVWGRNTGWVTPAFGTARPLIQGGLFWGDTSTGNLANGTLNNMAVINDNQLVTAARSGFARDAVIGVGAAGNMEANNSALTAIATTAVAADNLTAFALQGGNIVASQTDGLARSQGGVNATATGFRSLGTAFISGSSTSALAINSGTGTATATGFLVNSFVAEATVTGGLHKAEAQSVGRATAQGIVRANVIDHANSSAAATSTGTGDAVANSVSSSLSTRVTGGMHTSQASSGGNVDVVGILSFADATLIGASTSATAESSGAATVTAQGVSAFNNLTVSGGSHTAQASGPLGSNTQSFGIRAFNQANVEQATISSTANSPAGASATGVSAVSGVVNTSTITVQANLGTALKCSGVTSSDGSCT